MKDVTTIPRAVINRLARYHFLLSDLKEKGIEKISSQELSRIMGITASQLRQDLSYFGEFGQRGYGYRIQDLFQHIQDILGMTQRHTMVVIGAGNLGQALVQYSGFRDNGFQIKALFDINPKMIGMQVAGVPVLDVDELAVFIRRENISLAAITVPKMAAQSVAEMLVDSGVDGIWNFAPMELKLDTGIPVENVNLLGSLLVLTFNVHAKLGFPPSKNI